MGQTRGADDVRHTMTQPPEVGTTNINGCDIFHEWGGSGETIVFVHGGFPNLTTLIRREEAAAWTWGWEHDFAERSRFVWYDRRGCYRSSTPSDGYDLHNQVEDLDQLMDDLDIDTCHLIGSSAGGPISLLFAATRPSRIRSLALCGTASDLFPDDDSATQQIKAYIEAIERAGNDALLSARPPGTEVFLDALWEPDEARERGETDEYETRLGLETEQALALPPQERQHYYAIEAKAMQAYMNLDLHRNLAAVSCRTLVVHGENDRMVPLTWGESLAAELPNAQLHTVPNGPHGLVTRSPEVRSMLLQFCLGDQG